MPEQLRVIIGCERSGVLRRAFAERGHVAYSCDLAPAEDGERERHIQGDVLEALRDDRWHVAILHPPCTFLASSGLHWNHRREGRSEQTEAALEFVRALMRCKVPRWAIENPVGCISSRIREPDQVLQPFQYGDDASKATCLWLRGLPRLRATAWAEPREVDGRYRWGNQTDSGQNKLSPSEERAQMRSETYPGIAAAMAAQWGGFVLARVRKQPPQILPPARVRLRP